jgi:hypothetical protein
MCYVVYRNYIGAYKIIILYVPSQWGKKLKKEKKNIKP